MGHENFSPKEVLLTAVREEITKPGNEKKKKRQNHSLSISLYTALKWL